MIEAFQRREAAKYF